MKKSLLTLLMSTSLLLAAAQADYVIVNGRIVDGTGNSWFRADIAIRGNRIVGVSKGLAAKYPNASIIDAKNNIVAPGFIDVHAHIEESIFKKPTADNYI